MKSPEPWTLQYCGRFKYTYTNSLSIFLVHIFDELLEKSPGRKSTGNSEPTGKTSTSARVVPSYNPSAVLTNRTGVLETSTLSVGLGSVKRIYSTRFLLILMNLFNHFVAYQHEANNYSLTSLKHKLIAQKNKQTSVIFQCKSVMC